MTKNTLKIWFNRSYGTAFWIMKQLKNNPDNVPVVVIASHVDPYSPTLQGADFSYLEPDIEGEKFIVWALDFCAIHEIDVFIPMKHVVDIANNVQRFNDIGVDVLVNTPENIGLFEDKDAAYQSLSRNGFPVPPYRVARGSQDFVVKLEELRNTLEPGTGIIIKPITGVGASGFRIIDDSPYTVADLLRDPNLNLPAETVVSALQLAETQNEDVPALMIMPFLESPEISVDSLSDANGKLIVNIPRTKDASRFTQFSDRFPEANAIVKRLVELYGLQYCTNTQLRWWNDELVILETNTRMSGGLYTSEMTGVAVIWNAVKVLIGQKVEPLVPALDSAYTSISVAVLIEKKVS